MGSILRLREVYKSHFPRNLLYLSNIYIITNHVSGTISYYMFSYYINSFNLRNNPMRCYFHLAAEATEKLSNLPDDIQLVIGEAEVHTYAGRLPSPDS